MSMVVSPPRCTPPMPPVTNTRMPALRFARRWWPTRKECDQKYVRRDNSHERQEGERRAGKRGGVACEERRFDGGE
eukprot:6094129-Pyramimonas_sp.AAC.1